LELNAAVHPGGIFLNALACRRTMGRYGFVLQTQARIEVEVPFAPSSANDFPTNGGVYSLLSSFLNWIATSTRHHSCASWG
jgi:hypothetical protein